VDALKGATPEAFTEAFQMQEPLYKAIVERYRTDVADKKTTPIGLCWRAAVFFGQEAWRA